MVQICSLPYVFKGRGERVDYFGLGLNIFKIHSEHYTMIYAFYFLHNGGELEKERTKEEKDKKASPNAFLYSAEIMKLI